MPRRTYLATASGAGILMFIDFRQVDDGSTFNADLCIIGAGAAGIALACSAPQSLKTIIIESGGLNPSPDIGDLLYGETTGLHFNGLTDGRVRALGGTTRRWSGGCVRLDPIDFQKRDWVPYSGWPIKYHDISPYYDRAERFLGVSNAIHSSAVWDVFGMSDPGFHPGYLTPKFIRYIRKPDFKKVYGRQIHRSQSIEVLLNATVVRLHIDHSGSRVVSAHVRSLTGRSGQVCARAFVLCGGGIENPRILLASNDAFRNGLGNEHGLVGRFLQDHPNARTATVTTTNARTLQEQFNKLHRRGFKYWARMALSDAAQRQQELLNGTVHLAYEYPESSNVHRARRVSAAVKAARLNRDVMRDGFGLMRDARGVGREAFCYLRKGRAPIFEPSRIFIQAQTEQAPDPNNRVRLSSQCDQLGIPMARIEWQVREPEWRTLSIITEIADGEFQRLGLGKLVVEPWLRGELQECAGHVHDFYHHMGTTRMSQSPLEGVVDTECRVHSVRNLYLAGSSVFPTSGWANPTLTIIALAIRLTDHLAAVLRQEG